MALIYHITTGADWEHARRDGTCELSARGVTLAQEGFIHASAARQVPLVANTFYRGDSGLVVLVIDTGLVEPEIRYEPARDFSETARRSPTSTARSPRPRSSGCCRCRRTLRAASRSTRTHPA